MSSKFIFTLVLAVTGNALAFTIPIPVGIFDRIHDVFRHYGIDSQIGKQADSVIPGYGFSNCRHLFPEQSPISPDVAPKAMNVVALCADHFATLYSTVSKTPLVVIERLDATNVGLAKEVKRSDVFYPDPTLGKTDRAELSDFVGTGFDRGHMANAADQPNDRAMSQSFVLSNIIAQDPQNNQTGAWSKVEIDTRKFVRRSKGTVYVYSGPLFNEQTKTIGANRVWVPSHLYKLVYDEASGRAWAHIIPNRPNVTLQAPISYTEFVKITGLALLQNHLK